MINELREEADIYDVNILVERVNKILIDAGRNTFGIKQPLLCNRSRLSKAVREKKRNYMWFKRRLKYKKAKTIDVFLILHVRNTKGN